MNKTEKLYETCRYAFYEEEPNAFSSFGKYVHSVLERYFKGELYAFELADVFEQEYERTYWYIWYIMRLYGRQW